jgi:cytidylate kinase
MAFLPKVIAMDGPAASGKSTVAEKLAQALNYLFFDTGVMYRAATYAAWQRLGQVTDEAAVTKLAETIQIDVRQATIQDGRMYDVLLDGEDVTWQIRQKDVERLVSPVSAYAGVRKALTEQQRRIALRGQVVMVGRDIGTVVCPEAELKVYLDASVEERARRRYQEKINRGETASLEEIEQDLRRRDQIDSNRAVAPLRIADDAVVIDSDHLSIEEVYQKILGLIQA